MRGGVRGVGGGWASRTYSCIRTRMDPGEGGDGFIVSARFLHDRNP